MEKKKKKRKRDKRPVANDVFERKAWLDNKLVCGIDEVGRGCLAGPVVTAAVILFPNKTSRMLKDSKILTRDELIRGAKWVQKNSWFSYSIVDNQEIDAVNIYQATLRAMKRALLQLLASSYCRPSIILVDAMPLKFDRIKVCSLNMGEYKSQSIAAASIAAKIKRDEIMGLYDKIFNKYNFSSNKGYGTLQHRKIIKKVGFSILHRKSFLTRIKFREEIDERQEELFC